MISSPSNATPTGLLNLACLVFPSAKAWSWPTSVTTEPSDRSRRIRSFSASAPRCATPSTARERCQGGERVLRGGRGNTPGQCQTQHRASYRGWRSDGRSGLQTRLQTLRHGRQLCQLDVRNFFLTCYDDVAAVTHRNARGVTKLGGSDGSVGKPAAGAPCKRGDAAIVGGDLADPVTSLLGHNDRA